MIGETTSPTKLKLGKSAFKFSRFKPPGEIPSSLRKDYFVDQLFIENYYCASESFANRNTVKILIIIDNKKV